jgi:hypothetical protein
MTRQLAGQTPEGWPSPPGWCDAPGQFVSETGRSTVPSGYEVRDGQLVPTTLPTPSVSINRPPTTPPTASPTTTTTRPPVITTTPATTTPTTPKQP